MNIISLESSNIKRIKALTITPEGNVVVIGGKNGQGKTSVLDSIVYALAGASSHPSQPVRQGEDKGRIVCKLKNGLTVTRTFTAAGGTALNVTNGEGAKYPSPQAILDALVGRLSFDPLEFSRMPPKQQLETLKAMVGLDFTDQDRKRKTLYDDRTQANRDAKNTRARMEAMPHYPDAPAEEVSASDLLAELKRRQEDNKAIVQGREELASIESRMAKGEATIAEIDRKIAELQAQRTKAVALMGELDTSHKAKAQAVSSMVVQDEAEITAKLDDIQAINRKVAANIMRLRAEDEARAWEAKSAALTAGIDQIDKAKAEALAAASFPVPGLSFDESGVLFQGVPFSQASDAEKIRVSVSMGLAMNPKLKVILIRDGSLLDEDSLAIIAKMAADNDAQVWIERVGRGDECSVVIEDGQIVEDRSATTNTAAA